jgi:sterol O-acyltransferase
MAHVDEYKQGKITFVELYLNEMLPIPILILMLMVMIFDFFCTFIAELTGYPDHQFYKDYWNATTMSEFMSKMNCILPNFFRYHVVCKLVKEHKTSLEVARIISFGLATLALELLFVRICI